MPFRGGLPGDPSKIAVFTEASGGGNWKDINAPRNAPLKSPGSHLDKVRWHIDFFQYELAFPIQVVDINHPALGGRAIFWGPADQFWIQSTVYTSAISYKVPGQASVADRALFYHNLGYEPLAFVSYQDRMLMPGVAVQVESEGRSRFVSPYTTSTFVGLREVFNASENSLPAVTRQYKVLVFSVPQAQADIPLFTMIAGNLLIGRGKVNTSRRYLKRGVESGDSSFSIDKGPTVDIDSGRTRIVTGGSVTTEPGYAGGFSGSPYISVGV